MLTLPMPFCGAPGLSHLQWLKRRTRLDGPFANTAMAVHLMFYALCLPALHC